MSRNGFRRINWPLLLAPVAGALGLLSFPLLFVKWPVTRDLPWANAVLFLIAGWLLWTGCRRAAASDRWRTAQFLFAGAATVVSVAALGTFVMMRMAAADLPSSAHAPAIGDRAPDFALKDEHGRTVTLTSLLSEPIPGTSRAPKGLLLIFYMYSGCRACNSELHGVQQHLDGFTARGVRPVAVSIDEPATSRQLSEEAGYTFTSLSDPGLQAIRGYDVADQEAGARPAEFLVDSSGVVRWRYLTRNLFVRARPETLLQAAALLP